MRFESVRIVLVATSHPGNIGSAARAMKTMGFHRLYLVNPKKFPDKVAHELAAGADDILQKATVVDSLAAALHGCQVVFAASARARDMALPGFTPAGMATHCVALPDEADIALVFGREHAGLTNDELLQCHYHVNIPSNPLYSSLNLAQAVQIMTYELRMKSLEPAAHVETRQALMATCDEVELFYTHLTETLLAINFLKAAHPKRLMPRLRRMFNRVKLEQMEVNILRGILTQIQRILHEKQTNLS